VRVFAAFILAFLEARLFAAFCDGKGRTVQRAARCTIPLVRGEPSQPGTFAGLAKRPRRAVLQTLVQGTRLKKDWTLDREAFSRLLDWLDEGANSEGKTYLEMRRRLVAYFDRKSCSGPNELADETLNRVARKLEEVGAIETETPAKYCYVIARFVFLESLRARVKDQQFRDESRVMSRDEKQGTNEEKQERMLECLAQCTDELDPEDRGLILRYYHGRQGTKIENRRALASELGVTMNALAIRACRLRDKLELCVRECVRRHETNS
jgi:DNA-directed RNA polymerase specialized sigma24 family protein